MKWFAALLLTLQFGLLDAAGPAVQRSRRAPAPGEAFTVGVLRADGVILPFAAWDGEGWSPDWPTNIQSLELPIDLDAIPEKWWGLAGRPSTFALWSEGERIGDVTPERPAVVRVLCDRRIGLRTARQAPAALPPPSEPFPKQGLVISGQQPIDPIARISVYSPDFKAVAAAIGEAVAEAEDRATRRFSDWKHPFSREQRRKVPVELEALYRAEMDDPAWGSAAYIEGVKKYPVRPWEEECGLVTSVSGWIRRSPKGEVKYDLSARITYCDRRGVTYMLPLGVLKVAGRTFWVFQTSGWTGEWYSVVRPSPKGVEYHVDYFAGRGCER
jgi:hypothetical protein